MEGFEILDDLYLATGDNIEQWKSEGEAKSAREILLRLGRKRFGVPEVAVVQALEAITSVESLQQLAERLLEVESWEELLKDA